MKKFKKWSKRLRLIEEADKEKEKKWMQKNHADALIAPTEQSLKEHGSKISEADKKTIEKDMEDLKEAD
jgi:molecular chaperone DnaK